MENNDLRKYELLGATLFQKIVLKVETLKFIILDKFFPNSQKKYNKYCDVKCQKACKKVSSEQEKQMIINYYKFEKLKYKKELVTKKNRNYHLDLNNPNETIDYLNMNKKIHKKGMIKDIVIILISLIVTLLANGTPMIIALGTLTINCLYLLIDFECFNLQNYNLKRLKINKNKIEKLAQKRQDRNIKKYGKAASIIANELSKTDTIPKPKDIISKVDDLEQLKQMRTLLSIYIKSNNEENEKQKGGQKIK